MMSAHTTEQSQLGKATPYVDQYNPALLFAIARGPQRNALGVNGALPFTGADLWTGYELSWLNPRGKPQVALVHITVPCETPHIVESKSLKLYLGSFNNTVFSDANAVRERIAFDLGATVWLGNASASPEADKPQHSVGVRLVLPEDFAAQRVQELDGLSLDRLDVECTDYQPAPGLLKTQAGEAPVEETLVSHLLRSNCPVTNQPDWGDVQIRYHGAPIDHAGLLRYIVSYRNHNGFHEHCVERIFMDIWQRCQPTQLTVYARYTRRGGLDINPLRTNTPQALPPSVRTARQ